MGISETRLRSFKTVRGRRAVATLALAVVAIPGGGVSARGTVLGAWSTLGLSRPYVFSHRSITARTGAIVWAIEADYPQPGLTGPRRPSTWPWLPVQSSDDPVLRPIALCTHNPYTHGYNERLYAFRAQRIGRATLSAPLAPAWRRVPDPPRPFRATVTVAR